MGSFVKGDVVIFPFPFTDLSSPKKRPALVVAVLPGDDVICAMITSQAYGDAVVLSFSDFSSGTLKTYPSFIRPNRLFTADSSIISKPSVGKLKQAKIAEVQERIINIFSA